VDLRRLRYFVTVADHLHFGRAAEQLHMAQPPLSQQVRRLEGELGLRLLERTTRRVTLTEAGAMFLPHARQVLARADEAARAVETFRRGESGVLRIAFVDSASYDVMPRLLRSSRERYPGIEYRLETMSSDEQQRALRERRIDMGVGRVRPRGREVVATSFLRERLMLAVPSGHELCAHESVTIEALGDSALIGFRRTVSPSLFADYVTLFARRGLTYDPIIEATEYVTVLGLVAAGQGMALVPASVRSFRPSGLSYLPVSDPDARASFYLVRREQESSPLVRHTTTLLIDLFAGADEAG